MSDADKDRAEAASLPDGDVVAVLLRQHADIREGLDRVTKSSGDERRQNFEAIKAFLKAHETAEQAVVRPAAEGTAGDDEVEARLDEEKQADKVIAALSALDVDSAEFASTFSEFVQAVADHAEAEEDEEFPTIVKGLSAEDRIELGTSFLKEFAAAGG